MGEYAELYAMQTHGVDISVPNKKKTPWKWACPVCKKNFSSMVSQRQHIATKHPERRRIEHERR